MQDQSKIDQKNQKEYNKQTIEDTKIIKPQPISKIVKNSRMGSKTAPIEGEFVKYYIKKIHKKRILIKLNKMMKITIIFPLITTIYSTIL
jgi:hypothetical protein